LRRNSLGIGPDLVEAAACKRTHAILPVDVFGRPCRIEAVQMIARRRGWAIIDRLGDHRGCLRGPRLFRRGGRSLGSFGDVAVFAF
jgi:dTDP-4-amino-4,6-dideoxygalactose transaminase